jgi:hypothetical protein
LLLLVMASLATLASCSAPSKGALMLAVSTDMQTPKDISVISVFISVNSAVKFDYLGRVLPDGTVALPATVAVVEPDDDSAEVRIRVIGFKEQNARVLRDVLTTVPHQRVALLRLPLDFVDDGSGTGMLDAMHLPDEKTIPDGTTDFDPDVIDSKCDFFTKNETSIAGVCADAHVDSSRLPDYQQGEVYGDGGLQPSGAPTSCFDVGSCFGSPAPVQNVTMSPCSFPLPQGASADSFNVAFVTPDTGACLAPGRCYVPIVQDATEGWTVQGSTVQLAQGVCNKLSATVSLVTSTSCPAETTSEPVCEITSGDAGAADATTGDGGLDSSADAAPEAARDGGADATVDATTDAGSDAIVGDSGPDASACTGTVAALLAKPIQPPAGWLGLDLSSGGAADGGLGSGGLTIDTSSLLACASYVEPATPAGSPADPGYRVVQLDGVADGGGAPIAVEYNVQSRVISQVTLGAGYTGTLSFNSRPGGAYGAHTYTASILGPGSNGVLLRDGMPFASDWNFAMDDAGTTVASAWANEIYDGLMATFAPAVMPVADCFSSTFAAATAPLPGTQVSDCLFQIDDGAGHGTLGARQIGAYLTFNKNTNVVTLIYGFWLGGVAHGCSTPQAILEQADWAPIKMGTGTIMAQLTGTIGSLSPALHQASPSGLTVTEANSIMGCGGVAGTSIVAGYPLMQWGSSGEVSMDYNDAGVGYHIYVGSGYKGTLSLQAAGAGDAAVNAYVLGVGTALVNGSPLTIDWTSVASANPTITAIANSFLSTLCQPTAPSDGDCVLQGDCTIVPNDGAGHSTFSLMIGDTAAMTGCPNLSAPLTFVFPQGTSSPSQVYLTNIGGQ